MSDLRDQALALLADINTMEKMNSLQAERPVLPLKSLLIVSLRNSLETHVELTRQLSPETHEAAKHYYSLICAEYCELVEKAEQEELANA